MRIKEGMKKRQIGREWIVIDERASEVNMNKLFGFNETASYLWDSVAGIDFTVQTLKDLLLEKYDVDPETAAADAAGIADVWMQNGLAV